MADDFNSDSFNPKERAVIFVNDCLQSTQFKYKNSKK